MRWMSLCLVFVLLFSGCGLLYGTDRRQDRQQQQEDQESKDRQEPGDDRDAQLEEYYNGYLGLKISVQDGWYVQERNATNMTQRPEQSEHGDFLDREFFFDGSSYIDLISLENMEDRSHVDHRQMIFFAEDYIDLLPTLEEYVEACRYAYEAEVDGYEVVFVDQEQTQIGGQTYTQLLFMTTDLSEGMEYAEIYFIRMIGDLYFTACVSYSMDVERSIGMRHELEQTLTVEENSPAQEESQYAAMPISYYNGYIGLHVTLPSRGGYYDINNRNLTRTREESDDLAKMDINYFDNDVFNMEFLNITSRMLMEQEGYAQLELYADGYYMYTFEEYVGELQNVLSQQTDAVYSEILRSTVEVNGVLYERLSMSAENYESGGQMNMEYYITEVRGLYFIACLAYWADDALSIESGKQLLEETFRIETDIYVRI